MLLSENDAAQALGMLCDDTRHYPLLLSTLYGDTLGSAWISDSPSIAKSGFVLNEIGWAYIFGDPPSPAFLREIRQSIHRSGRDQLIWFGMPQGLRPFFLQEGWRLSDYPRLRFRFDERSFLQNAQRTIEQPILPIDRSVLSNGGVHIRPFWRSEELFLEKGFGFCIIEDGKVAAHALAASTAGGEAEIDIETKEEFRGKGYASALVDAFIRSCLALEITPKWDCQVENPVSRHLAESNGFVMVKEYPTVILDKANSLRGS